MNRQHNSKLSLFLMELIVAIFFFSLAAAVCIRLFTSAHLLAERTENLSNSAKWSQNLTEAFEGCKGDIGMIASLYPEGFVTADPDDISGKDGTIILFFDKDWESLEGSSSDASYEAILSVKTKTAEEVYSDVTDYTAAVMLTGNAAVGDIAVLDIRGKSEVYSQIPDDTEEALLRTTIDTYLGKEDG